MRDGFVIAALLLALVFGFLWRVSARAQEEGYTASGDTGTVNGLIRTLTANGAASIQFTGASFSANYKSLFLNCNGLNSSTTGATLALEVGEGSSPTWETTTGYVSANYNTQVTNASDILDMGEFPFALTTTSNLYLQFTINNPGSASLSKVIWGEWGGSVTEDAYGAFNQVTGWWNGDTNALTGIEVVPSSGTISGVCTLYGIP